VTTAQSNTPQRPLPPRKHGIIFNLLWGWPWAAVGIFLSSLLLSLVIEYACITFLWPERGASRSYQVMLTEKQWLSTEFNLSLLLFRPSTTSVNWMNNAYELMFIKSGILDWLSSQYKSPKTPDKGLFQQINTWIGLLIGYLYQYLLATVYIVTITMVRVIILFLSIPLFLLVIIVAIIEGLGRRDLRRYGAAYESSFVYHHARRLVKPAMYIPCMVYLSWPSAIYPNLLLLPAALLLGMAITVTVASFKKYL
jgi:integrating conjugative element membrane protein (TIGR03747 family)